jgi:hypothetical protein
MRSAISACVCTLLLAAIVLADDEVPVPLDKLPKSVIKALKAQYPKAKLVEAVKETEDGDTYYTVTIKNDKHTLHVSFTPYGKLAEINTELEIKELPKAVQLVLKKQYPGAMLEEALETVDVAENNRRTFTVTLTTAAKKKLEVTLDSKGSVLDEDEVKEEKKP